MFLLRKRPPIITHISYKVSKEISIMSQSTVVKLSTIRNNTKLVSSFDFLNGTQTFCKQIQNYSEECKIYANECKVTQWNAKVLQTNVKFLWGTQKFCKPMQFLWGEQRFVCKTFEFHLRNFTFICKTCLPKKLCIHLQNCFYVLLTKRHFAFVCKNVVPQECCICWQNFCSHTKHCIYLQNVCIPPRNCKIFCQTFVFSKETLRSVANFLHSLEKFCMRLQTFCIHPRNTKVVMKIKTIFQCYILKHGGSQGNANLLQE